MEEFFIKASYYCSLSEHCVKKVKEKLVQWETPKEFVQPIIDKLIEDDYMNEERFEEVLGEISGMEKVKVWQSEDTRRDRDVIWFNALLRRK